MRSVARCGADAAGDRILLLFLKDLIEGPANSSACKHSEQAFIKHFCAISVERNGPLKTMFALFNVAADKQRPPRLAK